MSNGIPIIISIVALVLSLYQFFSERKRMRREATIHAFDTLCENSSAKLLFDTEYKEKIRIALGNPEDSFRKDISDALPVLEHFAAGVNANVYDLIILNRMAGNKILQIFSDLYKMILEKRAKETGKNNYKEFEDMCNKLFELRRRHDQEIPVSYTAIYSNTKGNK